MIISKDPLGITHPAIRPGRLPEPAPPAEPVSTRDPAEFVAACLSCPLEDCNMSSRRCLIFGNSPGKNTQKRRRRGKP